MMKKSRFSALLLALALTLSVCPLALAAPDNPPGATVQELAKGDTMSTNGGIIVTNKGTVQTNAVGAQITENTKKGVVEINQGTVMGNAGTVSENAGAVVRNEGNIVANKQGMVIENHNTIGINDNGSTVQENHNTIGINDTGSTVQENKADATIAVNNGNVDDNSGTVTENEGDVDRNTGTVSYNFTDGTVTMAKGGKVSYNAGILKNAQIVIDTKTKKQHYEYGTDTLIGIAYCTEGQNLKSAPTEQWNPSESASYTVLSFEEVEDKLGKLPESGAFICWMGSDGKEYQPGDTYSDATAALRLTAKCEPLPVPETGDGNRPLIWAGLAITALAGCALTVLRRKTRV